MILDYEKAKDAILRVMSGKVSTVMATRVVLALKEAAIESAPVVHGRWDDFCNGKMCCCSVCKAEFDNTCNDIHGEWKFCPNCGARMDGDGDA